MCHGARLAFIAADAGSGTFGSGGCLKANHPGIWEQIRGGVRSAEAGLRQPIVVARRPLL